jgi:hypothetical protein
VYKTVLLSQLCLIPLRTLLSSIHYVEVLFICASFLLIPSPLHFSSVLGYLHHSSPLSLLPIIHSFLCSFLSFFHTIPLLQSCNPSSLSFTLPTFLPVCLPDCLPSSLPYCLSFSTLISLAFFRQRSIQFMTSSSNNSF